MTAPVLHIDFETRSELDLREAGLWNYARHPSTSVWCMAFHLENCPMCPMTDAAVSDCRWANDQPMTATEVLLRHALKHVQDGGKVYAHNAPFELAIWNEIMVPRHGWPRLRPEQTYCTMAMAYAMGLPGALEDGAMALGLSVHKDAEGRALMLRMARPRSAKECPDCDNGVAPKGRGYGTHWYCTSCNGKGKQTTWWDEPEKLARLYAYCQQDVRVERELEKRLVPLSDKERRVWLLDYKINQRGVAIDIPSAKAAVTLAENMKVNYDQQIAKITNGAAETCTALGPIKDWLAERGLDAAQAGLAKQDVVDFLAKDNLPADVRQVLICRQEAGKASTAKFDKMVSMSGEDGRLHNMYQYHGAGTGRWAGRAVQTHNLPRDMPKAKVVEKILGLVRDGQHDAIDAIYGPPLTVISRCLRSFFVAPPGKVIISGDFANVEGRGQAWFAGEDWKLKAFIAADNKTGPGIYELAYARMFGVPVESVANPSEERQVGKVSELAFGYQGGKGSFHTMGKNYGVKVSDDKAEEFKNAWRAAHPKIKATWYQIEKAAINAVQKPGEIYTCGWPGREARFRKVGSFLWLLLPSGRAICYPYPKILEGEYGPQLTYMTQPGPDKSGVIYDPKNSSNWARVSTYGGSLFNNIVQGFCRDLLAEGMLRLDNMGAPIVLHTHDNVAVEVPASNAEKALPLVQEQMLQLSPWASGFPIKMDCIIESRYR